jgi:hypothetical protein
MALPKRWERLVRVYSEADSMPYSRPGWPNAVEHVRAKCYGHDQIFWVALVLSVSCDTSQVIQDIPRP